MSETFKIGFLIFPDVTQLDFTGPAQVLARMSGAQVHVVAETPAPVPTDAGFQVLPTHSFEDCPQLDMICVPGGAGTAQAMQNAALLVWLRRQATGAQLVSSVCTGSLVLGAAGLLKGKRATSHWAWLDMLRSFGAEPAGERVVIDRNLITGGGVTSGIDFGLRVVELLRGLDEAERIRLYLEYDPSPIGQGGTPLTARPEIVRQVMDGARESIARRRAIIDEVARDLA